MCAKVLVIPKERGSRLHGGTMKKILGWLTGHEGTFVLVFQEDDLTSTQKTLMLISLEKLILKRPQWKHSKMYLGRARSKIDP